MTTYEQFLRRLEKQKTCQHLRRKERFREIEKREFHNVPSQYVVIHYKCQDCGLSFSAEDWKSLRAVGESA